MERYSIIFNLISIGLFCILLILNVLFNFKNSSISKIRLYYVKRILIFVCFAIAAHTCYSFYKLEILKYDQFLTSLFNELTYVFYTLSTYFFVKYINVKTIPKRADLLHVRVLTILPLLAVLIICAASFVKNAFFVRDLDTISLKNWQYRFHLLINFLYLFHTTALSFIAGAFMSSTSEKRDHFRFSLFIVMVMCGIALQIIFPFVSILDIAITLAICIIFLNFQDSQIFNDVLTNLNNRNRCIQYVTHRIETASPSNPFFLYMIDMNDFKTINDTLGHKQGDQALILAATSLKSTTHKCKGFAARYGGDEFVLIADANKINDPDMIKHALKRDLNHLSIAHKLGYDLTFSVGYTICQSSSDTIKLVFARADKMLYEDKAKHKKEMMENTSDPISKNSL